jgi:lipopolysaccharide transport system ATP-binding protein
MSELAIKVEGLSKRYRIGAQQQAYKTLREKFNETAWAPFRAARSLVSRDGNGHGHAKSETFWALKDASFEVQRGEVVGIVGRNGAGKSTLLKILSRITEPTEGYADMHGRIASLLEVGTGFHPELTGRENIFLNGSILGMKRAEINRKFDEIVAFAEIDKFIDTAVKHYSSGMYVRLAFAVAAHLDPEILMVDEVLAVGDAAFQKKCLGKMGKVAKEGRTILFVSHHMPSIASLCSRVALFDAGKIVTIGETRRVVAEYLSANVAQGGTAAWDLDKAPGDETARIVKIEVCDPVGTPADSLWLGDTIRLLMEFTILKSGLRVNPVFSVKNPGGLVVFSSANYEEPAWGTHSYDQGCVRTICEVPAHILNEGKYSVDAMLVQDGRFVKAHSENAVGFTVFDDASTRGDYLGEWSGVVRPRCEWQTETF